MIHFCIHPLSTQPPVWQSPRTVHSGLSRTSSPILLLTFPDYPAKLFNFFIRRPERLLATDHLLGMEIVTGLACFGLDEKTFPSCSPCVECTNHLLSLGTSFRRVEICGRIFFSLAYEQLNEEFEIIVVPLDQMIYIENFLLLKSFKSSFQN